jgi:hypothetical protein
VLGRLAASLDPLGGPRGQRVSADHFVYKLIASRPTSAGDMSDDEFVALVPLLAWGHRRLRATATAPSPVFPVDV